MNKQTLKKYYKNAPLRTINSYVKIDDKIYITNGISIMNLKELSQNWNWINMESLNYSIKNYIDSFKAGTFRALDLDNYNETCNLISFTKDSKYIKEHEEYDIGDGYSVNLSKLRTCCELIHATSASIVDLKDAGHPIIFMKNQKTGAYGWLLPCKIY